MPVEGLVLSLSKGLVRCVVDCGAGRVAGMTRRAGLGEVVRRKWGGRLLFMLGTTLVC